MSSNHKRCQGCPLLVACLADPSIVFRKCSKCPSLIYGPKVSERNGEGQMLRITDLLWERVVPYPIPPCYHQHMNDQVASFRQSWECQACRTEHLRKMFEKEYFSHIHADPAVPPDRGYLINGNATPLGIINLKSFFSKLDDKETK